MKRIMCSRRVVTLEDLQATLVEFLQNAKVVEGRRVDRDTILLDDGPSLVSLVQEKLTDGSHVYNLHIERSIGAHPIASETKISASL